MPIATCALGCKSTKRRQFLASAAALSGASLLGLARPAAAESTLDTTRIRIPATPGICIVPQYAAEPLLRAEGFTGVEYAKFRNIGPSAHIPTGEADMGMDAIGPVITQIDAGQPLVMLAGIHRGCYELFVGERV